MPFTNPIIAGTTLIRTAIESPNYSAGNSGWSIRRDGSAEFSDITARGSLQSPNFEAGVSGWAVNRDGTAEFNDVTTRGNLIVVGADGSKIEAYADSSFGAVVRMTPPEGTNSDSVLLQSYGVPGGLNLYTPDRIRVTPRSFSEGAPGGHLQVDGNLYMGTRDTGRGLVATSSDTIFNNSVTNIGTTVTPVVSTTARLQPKRTYKVKWHGGARSSANPGLIFYRLIVGASTNVVGEGLRFPTAGSSPAINVEWSAKFRFTRATAATVNVIVEAASGGTGTVEDFGNNTAPRGFLLYDIGSADDPEYKNFIAVT